MKPTLFVLFLISASMTQAAEAPSATYYIQLFRSSDQDAPLQPQAKPIGAKPDRRLHDVFKWKNMF